ncbi:MAG: two-component system LytT family sensor kinase, partial [Polaribacter sp.]
FLEIKPVKALDFFWVRLALWILGGLIVATAIWYFLKNRRTQRQAEKAKFDQMKMQKNLAIHKITPHFTFNVLTALSTLVLKKNPETAVDYISRFANLYRPLMVNEGKLFRTLRDEIQFNKDYLELEKLRFPKRFEFEINVAEEVNLESYVPSMAIHSFVNNAVKHGMEAIEKNGIVRIGIKEIDDILTVEIIDNGIGRSQSKAFSGKYNKGEGIKITQDIFNFLNQNFPKKSEIATIEDLYNKTPTGTRVVLKIYAKYPKEI